MTDFVSRKIDRRGSLFGTSPLITPRDEEANDETTVRPEDVEGVVKEMEEEEQSDTDDVGIY